VVIRARPNELSQSVVEMRIPAEFFQAVFIQAQIFAQLITTPLMWKSTELNAVLTQRFEASRFNVRLSLSLNCVCPFVRHRSCTIALHCTLLFAISSVSPFFILVHSSSFVTMCLHDRFGLAG